MDEAYSAAPRLKTMPLLYLYGGNDQVVPKRPSRTVMSGLGKTAKVVTYPTGYHMLLRDLNAEPRWADVAAWVGENVRREPDMTMAAE
jgi:alpha-beta hydrolase superfamily lysophospholipase